MALYDISNSSELLKRVYPNQSPAHTALQKSKFLAEVPKDTAFAGEDQATVVSYSSGSGVSASFEVAKANMSGSKEARFLLSARTLYSLFGITGKAISMANGNKGALRNLLDHAVQNSVDKFNRALSIQLWSLGGGAMTQLTTDTTVTNTYFTCSPKSHAGRFEVDDYLMAATDDGTGSSPTANLPGRVRVTAVNVQTGKVTCDQALSTGIAGLTNTCYIFRDGDYGQAINGVPGWIPVSDPSATAFKNVDRTACINKLSGLRVSGSGANKLDALGEFCAAMGATGGDPDRCYTNPYDFQGLLALLGDKCWIDLPNADPVFGHRGLRFESPSGSLIIVSEPWVPQGYAWCLKLSSWKFHSAGDCPRILNHDGGGRLHRMEGSDGVEGRIGVYGDLECIEPGVNGCITWA